LQNPAIAQNVQTKNVQLNAGPTAIAQKLCVQQVYVIYVNKNETPPGNSGGVFTLTRINNLL
jgi:hypothetical protein